MPIILISILVALISNYGNSVNIIEPLTFLKIDLDSFQNGYANFYSIENTYYLYNEWWRLITPMFIHFSLTHLVFNCLWIYVLGSKIELNDGYFTYINLIIFSSIISNLAQHFFGGSSLFGGLSGVIYGLLGYCMIIEIDTEQERYGLPPALYLFMLIWLILGFLGILNLFGFGNVANYAHLGGLISGIIFGMITRYVFIRDINE
jgi:GlpG protein|tara:strand:- start:2256 stop:2870 length:615 start_codon:yes stop_codon:yes gene_type:complete